MMGPKDVSGLILYTLYIMLSLILRQPPYPGIPQSSVDHSANPISNSKGTCHLTLDGMLGKTHQGAVIAWRQPQAHHLS